MTCQLFRTVDVQQIASILRNVGRRGKFRPTSGRRALAWRTTLQPSLMKSRRTVLSRRCRGSLSFLGAGIAASPLILIQLKAIGESLGRLLRWRKDSWEGRGSPMGGRKTGALENFPMWAKLPPPVDRSPIRGRMMASGVAAMGRRLVPQRHHSRRGKQASTRERPPLEERFSRDVLNSTAEMATSLANVAFRSFLNA